MKARAAGTPLKFQRDIQHSRALYKTKNLRFVRDNMVFYWRFLAYLEDTGYQPRTIERYYEKLRTFLKWLGPKPLRRVQKHDVEQFLLWFKQNRLRTAYTLRYVREALAVFFGFFMSHTGMRRNPAAGLRIKTHFPQPERMEVFSPQEVFMLIRRPLEERERIKRSDFPTEHAYLNAVYTLKMQSLMLKLLFSTGIRPCELVRVECSDLDEEHDRFRVRNKGNQQYIVRDRNVFLSPKTVRELTELRAMSMKVRNHLSSGRLFIHYFGGGCITALYPNKIIKYWARRCGIARNVYAYMCRYTYCTRLVENGVDLASLRQLMGHKQTATSLKHYLKLTPAELRKEWKQFNPLCEGNVP